MKERPILFNCAMVRAILRGDKTQTRRVFDMPDGYYQRNGGEYGRITSAHPRKGKFGLFIEEDGPFGPVVDLIPSPFGMPSDRLWVRETWRPEFHTNGGPTDCACEMVGFKATDTNESCIEAADRKEWARWFEQYGDSRWQPSIHMPRWASRITLEVTAVRVERLQNIDEEGAEAEGIAMLKSGSFGIHGTQINDEGCALDAFEKLWDSIYGKSDKKWSANPWVWVAEFRATASRELLPWMELTQDEIDALLPDHWSHYQRGGCLCMASYYSECACGAWSVGGKDGER